MKKIFLILLMLPALACSGTIVKPVAQMNEPVATAVATPSPTIVAAVTSTASPNICTVNVGTLNLRNAPTTAGTVIDWLYQDDVLTLLPDPPIGVWVKVITADKITGWINSTYCER